MVDIKTEEASLGRHPLASQIQENPNLKQVLEKYHEVIAGSDTCYPLSKVPSVDIGLQPEARTVNVPPQELPPDEELIVEDEIAEMAARGILKKIRDPKWVFPLFVAKGMGRRNAKKRAAIDFGRLNAWLKVVNHEMYTVDELVDSVPH
jgi:hypothetical protein